MDVWVAPAARVARHTPTGCAIGVSYQKGNMLPLSVAHLPAGPGGPIKPGAPGAPGEPA